MFNKLLISEKLYQEIEKNSKFIDEIAEKWFGRLVLILFSQDIYKEIGITNKFDVQNRKKVNKLLVSITI